MSLDTPIFDNGVCETISQYLETRLIIIGTYDVSRLGII
jgi:hypothetical protein